MQQACNLTAAIIDLNIVALLLLHLGYTAYTVYQIDTDLRLTLAPIEHI